MKQIDTDLWTFDVPLRFFGLEIGTKMTVIRLTDSKLFLHSPIPLTPELRSQIDALGTVSYLIAPNRFHHLFVGEWQQAYPEALTYVAPGLETKRSDLKITGVLQNETEEHWKEEIDQAFCEGFPMVNEVVFYHKPSKTLIVTDLLFNMGPDSPPLTRCAFKMAGGYGRPAPTVMERLLVRDRSKFKQSLETMLSWPFERILIAHGHHVESGGRQDMLDGYAWALR